MHELSDNEPRRRTTTTSDEGATSDGDDEKGKEKRDGGKGEDGGDEGKGRGERRSFRREGEPGEAFPGESPHTATAANDRGWSSSSPVWMCPLQGSWSKGRTGCGPRVTWRKPLKAEPSETF